MSVIHAVLFDLDDTLFAHRDAVTDGLVSHLRSLGHPYDITDQAAELAAWRELEEHHYHRYLRGEVPSDGQRADRARDYAARHGVALTPDEALEWWSAFFVHYQEHWRLHEDALPCLDELQRRIPGVRFGIITNGELDYQLRKIDAVRLGDRFDTVVASGAVGVTKPDTRIFRLACDRLGVRPDQTVYVGDRLGTDAVGAAHAGLTGVWLDRHNTAVSAEERDAAEQLGVVRITALDELVTALLA
jgi:putative hydrolase of the HAD superfamily